MALNLAIFQKNTKVIGVIALLILVFVVSIVVGRSVLPRFLASASTCPVTRVQAIQSPEDASASMKVINWDTNEVTDGGVVQYGISATNLPFSAVAAESGRNHNVTLKFLTPNTTYYYLIKTGNITCDSSGQACKEGTSCVPWTFSTGTPGVAEPTISAVPATPSATVAIQPTTAAGPTQTGPSPTDKPISAFCRQVQLSIGKTRIATDWAQFQQYDIDANGIMNGKDVISCIRSGR